MTRCDIDLSAILVCRDDEDRAGHTARRVASHLRSLGLRFELLVVDEGSGDNTVALLQLLRREIPELDVLCGVDPGRGFIRGASVARGRALLCLDVRCEAPLAALGFALEQLSAQRRDAVAVGARYLVLHRVRTLRAHTALFHRRGARDLERRFLRRAMQLGLSVNLAAPAPRATPWTRLRDTLIAPLASRF